jgi:nitroreductase
MTNNAAYIDVFDVPLAALEGTVEREELQVALEAACPTPSAANLQPWMFFVVQQAKTRELLAAHVLNALGLRMSNHRHHALELAPALVLVCMDVLRARCRFGNVGKALFAIQDIAVAAHNARQAAWRRGLASHWIREIDFPAVSEALGLQPRFEAQALLAFGYASTETLERPPYLSATRVVRWEPSE